MIRSFLESNLINFLWSMSAFIVFVLILLRYGVKHILAAVDAREAKITSEMKAAEDAYVRAKQVQSEVDAKFAAAEGRIATLMAEARKLAENQKAELLEKGRSEIESVRLRSLRDIEAARHSALISLRQEIAEISMSVAEKIVRERLDISRHEALVGETMDAYTANREKR
jgi:F-type H+-transporting ATPase subunit b